uniref:Secreted protein n=1 Tax=Macrostomum lignano TaxID=282301 RepID=A0A1I8HWD5_9PLAT
MSSIGLAFALLCLATVLSALPAGRYKNLELMLGDVKHELKYVEATHNLPKGILQKLIPSVVLTSTGLNKRGGRRYSLCWGVYHPVACIGVQ